MVAVPISPGGTKATLAEVRRAQRHQVAGQRPSCAAIADRLNLEGVIDANGGMGA